MVSLTREIENHGRINAGYQRLGISEEGECGRLANECQVIVGVRTFAVLLHSMGTTYNDSLLHNSLKSS